MYDFWFTLGTSIMHPGFLEKAIEVGPPYFKHIIRVTTEIPPEGTPCTNTNCVSAGLLEKCTAKEFRLALRAGFMHLADSGKVLTPPPTSFYTVGRLSQLITTPNLYFMGADGNLAKSQEAYKKAGGHKLKKHSPAFPAFLGLCVIDGLLRQMHNPDSILPLSLRLPKPCPPPVDNCPDTQESLQRELAEILAEFHLSQDPVDPERVVISRFIDLTYDVTRSLLGADSDPWEYGCPDWIGYWSPQSDRVIS